VIDRLLYGGGEGQLCELVRGLDSQRFQCFVYCLSDEASPYEEQLRAAGAELRFIKRLGHFDIVRLFKLARFLRQDRIDLVHAFLFLANAYTWLARRPAGVRYLVTSARNCKEIGALRRLVNQLAFRGSDAIICNGETVRTFAVQHFRAPDAKIAVIANGVDLARFAVDVVHPCEPVNRSTPAERIVLTIGRLVPQKDLELFIEAASLLTQMTTEVRFVIVGEGPCRERLERRAAERHLADKISFLGTRGDIPALLHEADIFWLTSAWEGMPNVLLEAMACAKPIVARDVGACREVVTHGVNGYLVTSRDAGQIADYTLDLLTNPARAQEMGQAGLRRVEENLSISAMIQATEQLYGSLLKAQISH
jgi:glycosyltransferase involved in cell wall biosynthesis